MRKTHPIIAILLALFFAITVNAQLIVPGKVVNVVDGKTVIIALSTGEIKVELEYIDVPVSGEPMYDIVVNHLKNLVLNKTVGYRTRQLQPDRMVGKLILNNVDISQQMLRDGAAWHMPARLSGQDPAESDLYSSLETSARNEKLGLWADQTAMKGLSSRYANKNVTAPVKKTAPVADESRPVKKTVKPKGKYADVNPALGDVGALYHGYNAETHTGYVGTSPGWVTYVDGFKPDFMTGMDVTYFYRENERTGRAGFFVLSVFFKSANGKAVKETTLTLSKAGKDIKLTNPKRTEYHFADGVYELWQYHVGRDVIETLVNNDDAYLHVGPEVIRMTGVRYLLYDILKVAR